MKLADYKKLTKLMMMTQSDNDNETLEAIRGANKILAAYGIDWNRVFSRTVQVVNEVEQDPEHPEAKSAVDALFASAFDMHPTPFIESIYEQWQKRSWLSTKQLEALQNFVDSKR